MDKYILTAALTFALLIFAAVSFSASNFVEEINENIEENISLHDIVFITGYEIPLFIATPQQREIMLEIRRLNLLERLRQHEENGEDFLINFPPFLIHTMLPIYYQYGFNVRITTDYLTLHTVSYTPEEFEELVYEMFGVEEIISILNENDERIFLRNIIQCCFSQSLRLVGIEVGHELDQNGFCRFIFQTNIYNCTNCGTQIRAIVAWREGCGSTCSAIFW